MTGYGRGEADHNGAKVTVELNSVNRKQSEFVINLPHEFSGLEGRVRQTLNERLSRGRTSVSISYEQGSKGRRELALDIALARSYHDAMRALQKELGAPGEITIGTILQAPGVVRFSENDVDAECVWPAIHAALAAALGALIRMREREGKHLATDLRQRLKLMRDRIKEVSKRFPGVVKRYRDSLRERINKAGLELASDDERLLKEIAIFADRSDVSEELTRLDSHFTQFAEQLRKEEPVGRTLEFITQEIFRELNTLGAKANDAAISQHVVVCKAELEKIREQIQNVE